MSKIDSHIIDEYLSGLMSDTDQVKFEHQIANNPQLKATVDEQRTLLQVIDALGDKKMKIRTKAIHDRAMAQKNVKRIALWQYAVAAGFALVLAAGIWLWSRPADPQALYTQYYQPYAINFNARDINTDQQLAQLSQFYQTNDCPNALKLIDKMLLNEPPYKDRLLLAGSICYIETKNEKAAIGLLNEIISLADSPYHEHGLWYSALIALNQNNLPLAKQHLTKLTANPDFYYYQDAQQVLKQLN